MCKRFYQERSNSNGGRRLGNVLSTGLPMAVEFWPALLMAQFWFGTQPPENASQKLANVKLVTPASMKFPPTVEGTIATVSDDGFVRIGRLTPSDAAWIDRIEPTSGCMLANASHIGRRECFA